MPDVTLNIVVTARLRWWVKPLFALCNGLVGVLGFLLRLILCYGVRTRID